MNRFTLLLTLALLGLHGSVALAQPAAQAPTDEWWNQPYPTAFNASSLKPQPFVAVQKNHFVDEQGKTVTFRGVNVADPDKLLKQKQWSEALFTELATKWGVNAIRLPIHPTAWRARGKDKYLALIDQAVVWANKLGMYLIIDWHSIGYLPTEQYQHPMYDTTNKETRDFWRTIAFRYKDVPTVAVYELFNEPTNMNGALGKADWKEWKALNESLIDMIWAQNKRAIPLVAGFNWAYDLSPVKSAPIARPGVAYAIHPYPMKAKPEVPSKENFFKMWEETWGYVAKKYPMIATEIGWVRPGGFGAHIPVINDGSYGPLIAEFMKARGVSFTVWCFDPEWAPTMIENWSFKPTESGAFFKQLMLEEKQAEAVAPAASGTVTKTGPQTPAAAAQTSSAPTQPKPATAQPKLAPTPAAAPAAAPSKPAP